MAIHRQGTAGQSLKRPEPGASLSGLGHGKYPSMQDLAGAAVKAIAVAQQSKARLTGITPIEKIAKIRSSFFQNGGFR
jgi:hypothetical protein